MLDKLFLSVSWWGAARDIVALSIFILFIFVCSLSAEVQSHIGLVRDYASSTAPWDSLSSLRCGSRSLGVVRGEILRIFSVKSFVEKQIREIWKLNQEARGSAEGGLVFAGWSDFCAGCMHILSSPSIYIGDERRHAHRRGREDGGRADDTLAHQRELCSTRGSNAPFMYIKNGNWISKDRANIISRCQKLYVTEFCKGERAIHKGPIQQQSRAGETLLAQAKLSREMECLRLFTFLFPYLPPRIYMLTIFASSWCIIV